MSWIHIIYEELARLRLVASAALGGPTEGDLAVEAALGDLFEFQMAAPHDRTVLYRLLDRQMRALSALSASERMELLKHLAGFCADEAQVIVEGDTFSQKRSAV